jgi:hypothetical protein
MPFGKKKKEQIKVSDEEKAETIFKKHAKEGGCSATVLRGLISDTVVPQACSTTRASKGR